MDKGLEMGRTWTQAAWRPALVQWATVLVLAAVLGLAGLNATPAHAQSKMERQLASSLKAMSATDKGLDDVLRKTWGSDMTAAQLAVMRPALRRIFEHPAMARYLTKLVEPLGTFESIGGERLQSIAQTGMVQLQAAGLSRLAPEHQLSYVQYMADLLNALPVNDCAAFMDGNMPIARSAQMEREYLKRAPVQKLRRVMVLSEMATFAELDNYPLAPVLSPEQASLAGQAFERLLLTRAQDPKVALMAMRAAGTSPSADDSCGLLRLTFELFLQMAEPYRTWQVQALMEAMN